jgi:hypothetical protein
MRKRLPAAGQIALWQLRIIIHNMPGLCGARRVWLRELQVWQLLQWTLRVLGR